MEPPIHELNLRSTVVLFAINFRRMLWIEEVKWKNIRQIVGWLILGSREGQHKELGVYTNMQVKKVNFTKLEIMLICPVLRIQEQP